MLKRSGRLCTEGCLIQQEIESGRKGTPKHHVTGARERFFRLQFGGLRRAGVYVLNREGGHVPSEGDFPKSRGFSRSLAPETRSQRQHAMMRAFRQR